MTGWAGWVVEARLPGRPDRVVVRARRDGAAPVVLKATAPGASWSARSALRREARLLDQVRGPGVVGLLDVVDTDRRTTLVLTFAPTDLAAHPDVDLTPLRRTVDRLHEHGVAHRALRPEHVLLTADGDPVLCGFGAATRDLRTDVDDLALEELVRRRA